MRTGRPKKSNVKRDLSGKSRGEGYHPETIARRERELEELGIPLTYLKKEGARVVEKQTAIVNLAGFTLGQLYLKWQSNPKDRMGVSEDEYKAGEAWAAIVRRHSQVMDYELKRNPGTQQWASVGRGISTRAEPDEEEIQRIRDRFKTCYDTLVKTGWATADLVYSVCVDNLPIANLDERKVLALRGGLKALATRLV